MKIENTLGIFDAQTEELIEAIEIPVARKKELFDLMKWQEPEDEIFGYDLTDYQVKVIGGWIGRDLGSARWVVQLMGVS